MSFLKDLNPVQQDAVRAVNGPVMIVAGAGSGKTRVLTYRIAHLIACGVPAHQILALTFTNKAAREMKSRIHRLVGDKARDVWMGTFHSMFARILRRECEHLGFTPSFTIYDSDDSLSAVKRVMEKLNLPTQSFNPAAIRSRISTCKNQILAPADAANAAADIFDETAARVYGVYQTTLARSNAMDFDDLLVKPIELFERKTEVLERYQRRFSFLLIDEFQDTNRAQYRVTQLLGARQRNICVVGDDAQSIYSFRGADIRNILDFQNDYPESQTFRLEQNYRSTKSILAAADRVIRFNEDQLKKSLWTDNPQGEPIRVISCSDDKDEGQQILLAVREEIALRKLDLKDFAVLYRTNAQSRSIEDTLRRAGIPYVIVGGLRFYERKEIKDVLAYLRLLANPRDDESFRRIVNVPTRGIGESSLDVVDQFAGKFGLSLFEAAGRTGDLTGLTDRARRSLKEFRALIDKYASLKSRMSLSEWTRSLVDELGILVIFKEESTAESMGRWENVQELLSAISEFSHDRSEATLESFLEEVALVSDIDTWDGERNAITLMTLHASKGLEFPVVVIAGLEEGLLPFYGSTIEKYNLEEERRLFYVGVTRAEQKLYLTHTKLRYRFGDATYPSPSRFVSELGNDHVEHVESKEGQRTNGRSFERQGAATHRGRHLRPAPEADPLFTDSMPDYESESQEVFEVKKGSLVQHETFGRGRVVDVSGKGEGRKAVVRFEEFGVKNLILKFANLRPG